MQVYEDTCRHIGSRGHVYRHSGSRGHVDIHCGLWGQMADTLVHAGLLNDNNNRVLFISQCH